jgi:beta-lactamase regulating signal transducer with metallopeptidase domain
MDGMMIFLNTMGKSFVEFSTSMLIQSSVLIIILLALDVFLRKRVRVAFLYGIWMLVLVKLVLPTTLSSPAGLGYWLGDRVPGLVAAEASSISRHVASVFQKAKPGHPTMPYGIRITDLPSADISSEPLAGTSGRLPAAASPATNSLSWQGLAFLGWSAVVGVMVLLLIRRLFFVRRLLAQSKDPNDSMVDIFVERCRKQMGVHRPISLRLSPLAVSPSACGIFRPTILIPQHLARKLKASDLSSVLLHELAHIKRGDVWVSLIQTVLQIAYFYNPLLWVANAMIRKVREQAVDEMVLVALGEQAEGYPETLLNISRMTFGRPVLNLRLLGVAESRKALERRIMIMLSRPVPKSSRLGSLGLTAIVVIGAMLLPMGSNAVAEAANTQENARGSSESKAIVPGVRVGDYTFDMSKGDVLERLGKPRMIFYGDERYTLDNLPNKYFMSFGDVSFLIVDNSVKGITALSPYYKFANGLGVGDSERKIKQAFGNDFQIKETESKDFLTYPDKGLTFEINKQNRNVMEINVSPIEGSESHRKEDLVSRIIVPGLRIGDYTFDMRKDDILERLGKPKVIFYGERKYTLDDLPEKYYMSYGDVSFLIVNGLVKEMTALSPYYKLPNGLRVGDSEREIEKAFGPDLRIEEGGGKDFLSYEDKKLVFEINKQDRTVREINVSPAAYSEHYKKADIPSASTLDKQGHIVDKIDYPFVNDPRVIGEWKSVDFVREMDQFNPAEKGWKGDLYLKELIFLPNGRMSKPWWTWTKGLVFHSGDKTASKYTIREIDGAAYMFFEWKSGDYTIRYMKPFYYVLKKVSSETEKHESTSEPKAHIPATSYINEQGRIVDKIDYPFVNDSEVIGTWKSVDFVREMDQFNPAEKRWKGDLYLKELIFLPNGKTFKPWWTWTKGLVFHSGDKTASKYTIKEIDGATYMFFEWKSGDYTIRHMKPSYYVLKKVSSEAE